MSIAVQYGASVLDGIDPGPVVVRQLFLHHCRNRIVCGQFTFDDFLLRFSGIFYVHSLGLMTLLYWFYDPVMFELTHTKRWIRIGRFTLQPSEIMKLAFVLFMVYLTLLYEKDRFSEQSNLTVSTF